MKQAAEKEFPNISLPSTSKLYINKKNAYPKYNFSFSRQNMFQDITTSIRNRLSKKLLLYSPPKFACYCGANKKFID